MGLQASVALFALCMLTGLLLLPGSGGQPDPGVAGPTGRQPGVPGPPRDQARGRGRPGGSRGSHGRGGGRAPPRDGGELGPPEEFLPSGLEAYQQQQQAVCNVRNKCRNRGETAAVYDVNCFCDDICHIYRDCCKGVRPPSKGRFKLSKKTVTCTRIRDISNDFEIYIVDKCPSTFSDSIVKGYCEIASDPDVPNGDRFLQVPVSGVQSEVLYRNYFCALCAGETNITMWSVSLKCHNRDFMDLNQTDTSLYSSINNVLKSDTLPCSTHYEHPVLTFRKCKSNIASCPSDWEADRKVERKCRKGHAAYVYPRPIGDSTVSIARIVFRNEFCATCHNFSRDQITCEDPRSGDENGIVPIPPFVPPFSILFDMNTNSGTVKVGVSGEQVESRTVTEEETCPPHHVYDPFASLCRRVGCPVGEVYVEGECTAAPSTTPTPRPLNTPTPRPSRTTTTRRRPKRTTTVPMTTTWTTPYYNIPEQPKESSTHDNVVYPNPDPALQCPQIRYTDSEYEILSNFSVQIISSHRVYNPGEYMLHSGTAGTISVCSPFTDQTYNVTRNVTYVVEMFKFQGLQSLVSFIGLIMSLVALIVTFVVYMLLPQLRNIPGKCIISLVVALFVAQGLYIAGTPRTEIPLVCYSLGAVMHYAFLASFFWCNALAMDICRTFTSMRAVSDSRSKRFSYYSLYAWIVPGIIVGGAVALDRVEWDYPDIDPYRPHYGDGVCWITRRYALFYFFALPLAILLVVNIILYIVTVHYVHAASEAAKAITQRDKDKNRLILYVKLGVIMGLTWIFGFLATIIDTVPWMWYLFIVFNTLQGVFVCLAFVCTRKVFRLLKGSSKVHKTGTGNARLYGNHSNSSNSTGRWGSTRPTYLYEEEEEAKIISQETSI